MVQSSLRIWSQFRSHFKYISASVHMPITQNHLFTPGLIDGTYVQWKRHGINTFKDLYKDGTFLTFLDLCSETNLPAANLFRYFQARHCTSALFPSYPLLPNVQPWEEFLSLKPNKKSIISLIYKQLMDLNVHSVAKIRGAWERELGVIFSDQQWEKAVSNVRYSTSCARLQLIQFKVLYRVYYSKSRLSEIYPQVMDQCERCHATPCDLGHMFFLCPRLHGFWSQYSVILSKALGTQICMDPFLAVFGLPVNTGLTDPTHFKILAFTSLLARRCILLLWKSSKPPSVSFWFRDVMSFLKLQKIGLVAKGKYREFYRIWGPFVNYCKSLNTNDMINIISPPHTFFVCVFWGLLFVFVLGFFLGFVLFVCFFNFI